MTGIFAATQSILIHRVNKRLIDDHYRFQYCLVICDFYPVFYFSCLSIERDRIKFSQLAFLWLVINVWVCFSQSDCSFRLKRSGCHDISCWPPVDSTASRYSKSYLPYLLVCLYVLLSEKQVTLFLFIFLSIFICNALYIYPTPLYLQDVT